MKISSKKATPRDDLDTLRPSYDFSKGVRGKYFSRFQQGTNLVRIDADLVGLFPDEESVNSALRLLANAAKSQSRKAIKPRSRQSTRKKAS